MGFLVNTMKGMRGFIKTSADKSSGDLKGGATISPKKEGAIGKRPTKGGLHYTGKYADQGKFRGSSDVSYRATSTGPAGRVVANTPSPHSRGAAEKEGASRGEPRSSSPQVSGARGFGKGRVMHAGKMESLKGKAKTSWEKR